MKLLKMSLTGKRLSLLASLFITLFILVSCAPRTAKPLATPQINFTSILVEANWLTQPLSAKELVIIDVRPQNDYKLGHIPGAVNLSLSQITDAKNPVRGMLVPQEQFETIMRGAGVNQDSTVVIYDEGNSPNPARLFWALHYSGFERAAIIDGGYAQWRKQNLPVDTKAPSQSAGNFAAKANPARIADKTYVQQSLGKTGIIILDVRSPDEYQGNIKSSQRVGHIPGAINLDWVNNLAMVEGVAKMKPAIELKQLYEKLGVTPDKEIIVHCQTGVRASQTYFTLKYLGYGQVRVYDGSWEEWGNDPTLPLEVGKGSATAK